MFVELLQKKLKDAALLGLREIELKATPKIGLKCRAYNGGNQGGSDGFTKCVEIITVGPKMTALVWLIAIEVWALVLLIAI